MLFLTRVEKRRCKLGAGEGIVSMAKPPKCFATRCHGESYGMGTGERVASGESAKVQVSSNFTMEIHAFKVIPNLYT